MLIDFLCRDWARDIITLASNPVVEASASAALASGMASCQSVMFGEHVAVISPR